MPLARGSFVIVCTRLSVAALFPPLSSCKEITMELACQSSLPAPVRVFLYGKGNVALGNARAMKKLSHAVL